MTDTVERRYALQTTHILCYHFVMGFVLLFATLQAREITVVIDSTVHEDIRVDVFEGDELHLDCTASVSQGVVDFIRWGKYCDLQEGVCWLSDNENARITVDVRNATTYSLKIRNVSVTDSGDYVCSSRYDVLGDVSDGYSYATISVKYFPKENPHCSWNQSKSGLVFAWCEPRKGKPKVNITWIIKSEAKDTTVINETHIEPTRTDRLRSEVQLSDFQDYDLITCVVTSVAFPGLNQTCSVGPITGRQLATISTTVRITSSTFAPDTSNVITFTPNGITSDGISSTLKGITFTGTAPLSSRNNASIAVPAVAVPVVLLLVFIAICLVKQKFQDRPLKELKMTPYPKSVSSTVSSGRVGETNGRVILPYSITTLDTNAIHDNRAGPTRTAAHTRSIDGGTKTGAPYEVHLNFAGETATYSEIPPATEGPSNADVIYYTVDPHAEASDSTQLQKTGPYEQVNSTISSANNEMCKPDYGERKPNDGERKPNYGERKPYGGHKGVRKWRKEANNGDQGMIVNPFYQPYDGEPPIRVRGPVYQTSIRQPTQDRTYLELY